MGIRFRKSIKILPGIKLNISKKGIGLGAGVKGFHVSTGPSGQRSSFSIPGTGISYVSQSRKKSTNLFPNSVYGSSDSISNKSKSTTLLLCLFLGIFGIHYFYVERPGRGFLYMFTAGLACMGWIIDIFAILSNSFRDGSGAQIRISPKSIKSTIASTPLEENYRDNSDQIDAKTINNGDQLTQIDQDGVKKMNENIYLLLFVIGFIGILFLLLVVIPTLLGK